MKLIFVFTERIIVETLSFSQSEALWGKLIEFLGFSLRFLYLISRCKRLRLYMLNTLESFLLYCLF